MQLEKNENSFQEKMNENENIVQQLTNIDLLCFSLELFPFL